jgi:hypothetical protein
MERKAKSFSYLSKKKSNGKKQISIFDNFSRLNKIQRLTRFLIILWTQDEFNLYKITLLKLFLIILWTQDDFNFV